VGLEAREEDVLIIKAEQHYIKVVTPDRNYMVLYRFSDAINEIDPTLGQQVHRSYWVNTNAITSVRAKAKDFFVVMQNEEQVPVSGPYQGMVRELARSTGLPLKN
jgi:DNA-binding LytR/AlgR family response regulator